MRTADSGTFDFHKGYSLRGSIDRISQQIGGYDHCFVTAAKDESRIVRVGEVRSDTTGIRMEISTNQRGMQVYSGNFLKGALGKGGQRYSKHTGICFETQRFPDAPNQPDFPSCILRPGEEYKAVTVYAFSTAD